MGYNDIIRIESSDGAQRVIDELTGLARSGGKVFRGYNKQDELLPSLIRDKVSYTDVESELLKDFERYGSHYFHAATPIDFMSYAQPSDFQRDYSILRATHLLPCLLLCTEKNRMAFIRSLTTRTITMFVTLRLMRISVYRQSLCVRTHTITN